MTTNALDEGHFPGSSISKESTCNVRDPGSISGSGRSPGEAIPVFLPGEPHGQRNMAGYSPWGCKSHTQLSD